MVTGGASCRERGREAHESQWDCNERMYMTKILQLSVNRHTASYTVYAPRHNNMYNNYAQYKILTNNWPAEMFD